MGPIMICWTKLGQTQYFCRYNGSDLMVCQTQQEQDIVGYSGPDIMAGQAQCVKTKITFWFVVGRTEWFKFLVSDILVHVGNSS